jgi:hypothetical protein
MVTPQSFAMASRTGLGNLARESPPRDERAVTHRTPARIHRI